MIHMRKQKTNQRAAQNPVQALRVFLALTALIFQLSGGLGAQGLVAPKSHDNFILVKYKPLTQPGNYSQNTLGVNKVAYQNGNLQILQATESSPGLLDELRKRSDVLYAEPNHRRELRRIPNDPAFVEQWALRNQGQVYVLPSTPGADMDLPLAWDRTTGSRTVVVAVIDDSIDINHPDLKDNIWTNENEIPNNGIDDDQNGYIDDVHGWDFVDQDNDTSANKNTKEGHGTSVSGVLGAVGNNGTGVTGVAWDVKIMPLKFGLDVVGEVQAIDYAIRNGAHIINASWGGAESSNAEYDAVKRLEDAGILLVVAAGNSALDNDLSPDYPSGLDMNNIISVTSSLPDDSFSSFSQFGLTSVDVAAPGSHLITTRSLTNNNSEQVLFGYQDGTSFSAPSVCGVAALIKSRYPQADATQMIGRLINGVEPINGLTGVTATDGRVNAYRSLLELPAPSIVIRSVKIDDSKGNGNGQADQGEPFDIQVQLQNHWQKARNLKAELSTTDPRIQIDHAAVSYPDLDTNKHAPPVSPFKVRLSTDAKLGSIEFTLTLHADGYKVSRKFNLPFGQLKHQAKYKDLVIQTSHVDSKQYFHIFVPPNTDKIRFAISSVDDLDLKLRYQSPFGNTQDASADVWSSAGLTGDEEITVEQPKSGTYYVQVVNSSTQKNVHYNMEVITSVNQGMLLNAGWNFVAIPSTQSLPPSKLFTAKNFSTNQQEAAEIWSWSASAVQWQVFSPDTNIELMSAEIGEPLTALSDFDPSKGFWIKTKRPAVYTPNQEVTQPTSTGKITLKKGWNYVASNVVSESEVSGFFNAAFASTEPPYDNVWAWMPEQGGWAVYSPLEDIDSINRRLGIQATILLKVLPNQGYIIHMRQDSVFTQPD